MYTHTDWVSVCAAICSGYHCIFPPLPKLSILSLNQNSKRMFNEQRTNEKVGLWGKKDSGLEELREAQAQIGFYGKTDIGTHLGKQTSLLFLYPDC